MELKTSSMVMETKAITYVLAYLVVNACSHGDGFHEYITKYYKEAALCRLHQPHQRKQSLGSHNFCLGHSDVNERADSLTGTTEMNTEFTLDFPVVIAHVREHPAAQRLQSTLLLDTKCQIW